MWPNPLSAVYHPTWQDTAFNIAAMWLVGLPVAHAIGWAKALIVYAGSGFLSSFTYLFQTQMNPHKCNTKYDCNATSNGAVAGLVVVAALQRKCYVLFSKRLPCWVVSIPYLLHCGYDEYVYPVRVQRREPHAIEITNWGFVGGCFFGLIFSSLVLRTRRDQHQLKVFFQNLKSSK
jgi:membrane associated rhomboid family serine protease